MGKIGKLKTRVTAFAGHWTHWLGLTLTPHLAPDLAMGTRHSSTQPGYLNILTICSFILKMNNKYKSITQDSIRFPKAIKTFFQVECAAEQTPQPTTLAKRSGGDC